MSDHRIARFTIRVQSIQTKFFLTRARIWTKGPGEAAVFAQPMEAIVFCIRCQVRDVRLVGQSEAGADVYLYPFGGDPVTRAELKQVRKSLRDGRRLKAERRTIQARMDMLRAEVKGERTRFPLKRKTISRE